MDKMEKKVYRKPEIQTEPCFESSALACGKTPDPPPGSFHFSGGYIAFTGHLGGGFGGSASISGTAWGGGMGATSGSYGYEGLCGNWVTFES